MAAGDAVVGKSGANAALTFTPAAGVEVVITAVAVVQGACDFRPSANNANYTGATAQSDGKVKIFVTNSQGIYCEAGGAGVVSGYNGVQTK